MYKAIILESLMSHYFMDMEERDALLTQFFHLFNQGTGEYVELPFVNIPQYIECRLFQHNDLFLIFKEGYLNRQIFSPVPIIGTIIPMFEPSPFNRHLEDDLTQTIATSNKHLPILVIFFHTEWKRPNDEPVTFDDLSKMIHKICKKYSVPKYDVIECSTNSNSTIPQTVAAFFDLMLESPISKSGATSLRLNGLPQVKVKPEHLGISRPAIYGFIQDCLAGLIPTKKHFRLWIDAVRTVTPNSDDTAQTLAARIGNDKLIYNNVLLSVPKIIQFSDKIRHWEPGCCRVEPAYHLYVELDGFVYDGLIAFEKLIPLAEYQSNLDYDGPNIVEVNPETTFTLHRSQENSTWRKSIDIIPDMTLDAAMQQLDNVLQRVKMGDF